ncbi:hypothetical protein GW17_00041629 [Ensete ventricosum]|nr:hypothetical protein GW17_00041629 [Ensete ventricosum]
MSCVPKSDSCNSTINSKGQEKTVLPNMQKKKKKKNKKKKRKHREDSNEHFWESVRSNPACAFNDSAAIRRAVGHRTSTSNPEKSAAGLAARSDQFGRGESDRFLRDFFTAPVGHSHSSSFLSARTHAPQVVRNDWG